MTVADLMAHLAAFDPDCPVEALQVETEWVYDGEESRPTTVAGWRAVTEDHITQTEAGVIRIGLDLED